MLVFESRRGFTNKVIFRETKLSGAYVIEVERIQDHRGFFGRLWCREDFQKMGLTGRFVQSNVGVSKLRGTLRGLHYQRSPHEEVKLVRCTRGAIYDVIVDLRPQSKSFLQWFGVELNEDNCTMIYVPQGFAQGYMTLTDNAEMYYLTSEFYHPEAAFGVRFDDPILKIKWPEDVQEISEQDVNWPHVSSQEWR